MAVEAYHEKEEQTQIRLSVLISSVTAPHYKRPLKPTDIYKPRGTGELKIPTHLTALEGAEYMRDHGRRVALRKILKSIEDEPK